HEALIEAAAELDALLCGGEGEVQVPHRERDHGTVEEVPRQRLCVAQQPCRLDRFVEQLCRLGQLAADVPGPAEDLVQDEEELSLPGRAPELERPRSVGVGLRRPVEIELGASEARGGVETWAECVA